MGRYYLLPDGSRAPSATTVISTILGLNKESLIRWANNLGLQGINLAGPRDSATSLGSCVHELIKAHWSGSEPELKPQFMPHLDRARDLFKIFVKWTETRQVQPILFEQALTSSRLRFGGTLDFYGLVDDKFSIVDFKTSGQVYTEYLIQVAAYKQLLEEHGYMLDQAVVVRLDKQDGPEEFVIAADKLAPYWEIFEHALRIYYILDGLGALP